jgi:diguanylate cyclase (GGDEF)-like protein
MRIKGKKKSSNKPNGSLKRVVVKTQKIKVAVEACVEELVTVNTVLRDEDVKQTAAHAVQTAMKQNKDIETKVQSVANDLNKVNESLHQEIKERYLLEHAISTIRGQEKAASHAALHDSLTSLPNRALFNDRLDHALAQARRLEWTLAVMFIDLDNFKAINDTHGHLVGDNMLKTLATRLQKMTREDDTVSRYGGDEFLYLLSELNSKKDAERIALSIIAKLSEPCEMVVDGAPLSLCLMPSIGIAFYPLDGESGEALIASADAAMYRAKRERIGFSFSVRSSTGHS